MCYLNIFPLQEKFVANLIQFDILKDMEFSLNILINSNNICDCFLFLIKHLNQLTKSNNNNNIILFLLEYECHSEEVF